MPLFRASFISLTRVLISLCYRPINGAINYHWNIEKFHVPFFLLQKRLDLTVYAVCFFTRLVFYKRRKLSPETVYPHGVWMPNDGVQRGSIMKIVGDPLTPLYPAKPTIYKTRDIEKVNLRVLFENRRKNFRRRKTTLSRVSQPCRSHILLHIRFSRE